MSGKRSILLIATLITTACGSDASSSIRQKKPGETTASANQREATPTIYGIAFGFFGAADVTVKLSSPTSEYKWGLKSGYSVAAFVDFGSRSWTSLGLSLETHRITPADMDLAKNMLDLSLNLKGNFRSSKCGLVVKPCAAVGFGYLPSAHYRNYEISSSSFIVVKGFLEFSRLATGRRPGLLMQLGVIAAPYGRASENDRRASVICKPRLLLRAGVVFK